MGWTTITVGSAAIERSVTPGAPCAGSPTLQLRGSASAAVSCGSTCAGGSVAWFWSPQDRSIDALTLKNRKVSEASPCRCQGVGPDSEALRVTPASVEPS